MSLLGEGIRAREPQTKGSHVTESVLAELNELRIDRSYMEVIFAHVEFVVSSNLAGSTN
jgi:hypothetical protein